MKINLKGLGVHRLIIYLLGVAYVPADFFCLLVENLKAFLSLSELPTYLHSEP